MEYVDQEPMDHVKMFSFSIVGVKIEWFVDKHYGMVSLSSCWFGYTTLY